jgi:hypothetical protein
VLRTLERAPEKRYQAAEEVRTDLEKARDGRITDVPTRRSDMPGTRSWWHVSGGELGVALAVFVLPTFTAKVTSGYPMAPLLAGCAGAGVLLRAAHVFAHRYPELLPTSWSRAERAVRTWSFFALALLGGALATIGVTDSWEGGTRQYVPSTTGVELESRPASLAAVVARVAPEVHAEIVRIPGPSGASIEPSYRRHFVDSGPTLFVAFALFALAGLALAWRRASVHLPILAACPLVAVLVLLSGWLRYRDTSPAKVLGLPAVAAVAGEASVPAEISEVRALLQRSYEQRGYELVACLGETLGSTDAQALARHEVLAMRPSARNRRWKWTSDGPRRIEPGIVFDLVSTPDGGRTRLAWNAGSVRWDQALHQRWRAEIEEVLSDLGAVVEDR